MGSLYSAAFSRFPPDWRQCRIDGVRGGHNTMVSCFAARVARQQPDTAFSSRAAAELDASTWIFQLPVNGRKACGPRRPQENV